MSGLASLCELAEKMLVDMSSFGCGLFLDDEVEEIGWIGSIEVGAEIAEACSIGQLVESVQPVEALTVRHGRGTKFTSNRSRTYGSR